MFSNASRIVPLKISLGSFGRFGGRVLGRFWEALGGMWGNLLGRFEKVLDGFRRLLEVNNPIEKRMTPITTY